MKKKGQLFIQSITNELPRETYTELAIWYYKTGCVDEAKQLFTLSLPSPEAAYWLAFLNNSKINFNNINPLFSFPFRSETGDVIAKLITSENNWLLKYHLALIYHDRNRVSECKQLLMLCGNEPAFAPFYAVRANVFADSNKQQALADLEKAFSLDKGWRYDKLLADYYLSNNQNEKALHTIEPYAKSHTDDYIMGLLYTKILIYNKKLAEADQVVSHLKVLPFEGATESHDLYREVKLKEAINELNHKNYKKGLAYVNESLLWPENLGVGKPYENDIDDRLESWLSYVCHAGLNNKKEADKALQKITNFSISEDNKNNVYSSNALITLWAYKTINQTKKGELWLQTQTDLYPDDKGLLWAKQMYKNETAATVTLSNSNVRILQQLMNE